MTEELAAPRPIAAWLTSRRRLAVLVGGALVLAPVLVCHAPPVNRSDTVVR